VNTFEALGKLNGWLNALASLALTAGVLLAPLSSQAQGMMLERKLSEDLKPVVLRGELSQKTYNWLKRDKDEWLVKVLVVSRTDADPEAQSLRTAILNAGGSVFYRYLSVNAVLALLPVNQVMAIASRPDVESISPNRVATQSASFEEQVTGAAKVREQLSGSVLDGRGVGIAFLDSGVMRDHINFVNSSGDSRIARRIGFVNVGDSKAISKGKKSWEKGVDFSAARYPGSKTLAAYEKAIDREKSKDSDDEYGHGTFVAGVGAGSGRGTTVDSTGVAPGADIFDLKVLNDQGVGQVGDVLAAIDWVIYHHKALGIRVMNMSLAADSTESYLTDPLCRAVRAAVASGITVVVAAGNYGKDADGKELYGSIASPANEPSVITVGAVRSAETLSRADDTINTFSSRGPTRGGVLNDNGERVPDNLLKPDLVAPGNNVISAEASAETKRRGGSALADNNPGLRVGSDSRGDRGVMKLSGTSVAAPAVAGTVALMLQANPGLTPPLIKAALQYSAQPVGTASLIQQGAGQLNVDGAVRIAQALRTDIAPAIRAGRLSVGDSLLAAGKTLPSPSSVINNETVAWSRLITAGGSYVLSGTALLTQYQAFYDPRLLWVRERVRRYELTSWPSPVAVNGEPLYFRYMRETTPFVGSFSTAQLITVNNIAGASNATLATGVFTPTIALANGVSQGVGRIMAEAMGVQGGVVLGSSMSLLGEGVIFVDGQSTGVGRIMAEGMTSGVGRIMAEAGEVRLVGSSSTALTDQP
jgi:subtilisin family serine protease